MWVEVKERDIIPGKEIKKRNVQKYQSMGKLAVSQNY